MKNLRPYVYAAALAATALPALTWAEGVNIPNPQTFNQMLAQDYSNFAKLEDGDATDMIDGRVLADRALSAYHGNTVMPLAPTDVRVVRATPESLSTDYTRIRRVVMNNNIVQNHPREVAMAQASYDCYALHQQSEPNASHNMNDVCEGVFRTLIDRLDVPQQQAEPVVQTTVKRYVAVNTSAVYFDWNKADLTDADKMTLDSVKNTLADTSHGLRGVALEGFADRSGPADYNVELSRKRIGAVEDYLGVKSVDLNDVDFKTKAYGETNLPVHTKDGVREPRNRVVKVSVVESKKKVETTVTSPTQAH